jgi:glycosyltransferase involved in cell wall biosynthesis
MAMRLKLTGSRSRKVSLYSIDARSRFLKHNFERSPRISIVTDVMDVRSIPREIRAIVRDERRISRDFPQWLKSKHGSDACIVWCDGDRLLEGSPRGLLKSLHSFNRRSFVVVNTPCVDEVPFLTIQPRIFTGAASIDFWSFRIRFKNVAVAPTRILADPGGPREPWAKLLEAISSEKTTPGAGVEPLLRLWESRDKLQDLVGALVLRNLVAAMFLHRETDKERKFLEAGVKLYPTYAELHYLAALLSIREHRFGEAFPLLERAKSCSVAIPGAGGENSYRCDWLLGVLAAQVGNDHAAFQHFLSGVKHNPLFEPSLTELLKLRLPHSLIESHQHLFTQAARWNPHMAGKILEYLLTHRAVDAARLIERTMQLDSAERQILESQPASSTAPHRAAVHPLVDQSRYSDSKQTVGIAFEGQFFEHSSLARVNREIAHALSSSSEFELRLETSAPAAYPPHLFPDAKVLAPCVHRRLQQTNLTIRHQWPPNFRRPPTGKLAVILPWEYGGVPRVWIDQIQQNVDELWVPSSFVREVFVRHGVTADRVRVIPNGYDPRIFRPEGPILRPPGSRDFIFLFVGGAIRRKGIDLLLDAYMTAFEPSDKVTLVLLVSGSTGAYQHNSLLDRVRAATADPEQPPTLAIYETVDDSILANLYRGAGAFVLPYRGEGFGMPLLEAMACGKPVIATAEGPAKEFCDGSNSYLVSATADLVLDPPPLGPIVGNLTWFEPAFVELTQTLRHVWENREEAAAKGRAAAQTTRHLTWQNATDHYAARIRHLCNPNQ